MLYTLTIDMPIRTREKASSLKRGAYMDVSRVALYQTQTGTARTKAVRMSDSNLEARPAAKQTGFALNLSLTSLMRAVKGP
jgi:hypothetical protein